MAVARLVLPVRGVAEKEEGGQQQQEEEKEEEEGPEVVPEGCGER